MHNLYPHVSNSSKAMLAIRSNYIDISVVSERVLSTAGNIISSQRTRLLPENATMLICIKHFQINIDIIYFQYYVLCFRHVMMLNIHM